MTTRLILIRFNTDHPKDPDNTLAWRIIDKDKEYQASGFIVNTTCFDQSDAYPEIGMKWHVATLGKLRFDGTIAIIE
jgi:hypothetical protein